MRRHARASQSGRARQKEACADNVRSCLRSSSRSREAVARPPPPAESALTSLLQPPVWPPSLSPPPCYLPAASAACFHRERWAPLRDDVGRRARSRHRPSRASPIASHCPGRPTEWRCRSLALSKRQTTSPSNSTKSDPGRLELPCRGWSIIPPS